MKDEDFFIDIQEAIKDSAGNILGWIDGIINKTEVGKPERDPVLGLVQDKNLVIDDGYAPIIGNEDGSGSWKATIIPNTVGTSYFKVTESKKYHEREILEDGSEGEVLYIQEDGTKGIEKTEKSVLSEGSLPGVTYDETIYYLKYINGVLDEVRMIILGANNTFSDLETYNKEEIKEIGNGKMPIRENPINKVYDYLVNEKGVVGINESEFSNYGKENENGSSLDFNNIYDMLTEVVEVEGNKDLVEKDLIAGEFEFVIKDKDGNILGKATNDEKGKHLI